MAVSPSLIAEAVGWRREFHAAPELGYQEQETSRRVAELLASFGLQVHRGLAGTGVVATLENGPGPVIGLRADMDALPITELGSVIIQVPALLLPVHLSLLSSPLESLLNLFHRLCIFFVIWCYTMPFGNIFHK